LERGLIVHWCACMMASEMKAAETCLPPNQRPFKPCKAFRAASTLPNFKYISP
jgi:hypothetical protein